MNCPNCQNDVEVLERNFGALFTCPKCQAVYFLNFDGTPEYSSAPIDYNPADFQTPQSNESEEIIPAEEVAESVPLSDGHVDAALGSEFSMELAVETVPEPQLETDPQTQPEFESTLDSSNSFTSVAQEISDFGNTEVQIAALNYDLEISGLDSKEEVKMLEEALTDSRFGWDVADLLKSVRHGRVSLEKLNPIQAYVIIKRIHFLGLDMKWTQNVLE